MKLVENYRGRFIDLDIVAGYMHEDIRERLHSEMSPCEPQAFYDAYVKAHEAKYNEPFGPDMGIW